MKKLILGAILAGFALSSLPATASGVEISIATDDRNDWDTTGRLIGPDGAPVGSALGQDLIEAAMRPDYDAGIMNFIIKVTELAPIGGTPEATRYTWNFVLKGPLGDNHLELDGKYTNYSRGACDPTALSCPPPRDPGAAPFFVRGNCGPAPVTVPEDVPVIGGAGTNVTTCQELAKVEAAFDVESATITVPVPVALLDPEAKLGACPVIKTGTNLFGGFLSAIPSAFFSSSAMPRDVIEDFFMKAVPVCEPEAA